jgi:hypothetical protein
MIRVKKMRKNILKNISIVFLLLVTITVNLIFPFSKVSAQSTNYNWYGQPFHEWYLKVYDNSNPQEIFGERYAAAQVQWVLYSIPSFFMNLIFGQNTQLTSCLMLAFTEKNADIGTCLDGTKSIFSGLTGYSENANLAEENNKSIVEIIFEDRELSGITYVKNSFKKFSIIPRANAANEGYGFGALGPITELWKVSRNFAFAIFSFAIIIFSFMIMFRVKINPQTVITIQSALPKIVIALILVTFSYAIAGLMIDLMYIITGLISLLLNYTGAPTDKLGQMFRFLTGEHLFFKVEGALTIFAYSLYYLIFYFIACILASLFIATTLSLNGFGTQILAVLLIVFTLVLIVILIINLFKVIWMLFQNLAQFYLQVIIGPLQIALGTIIPNMGFGPWLKGIASKLAVFPALGLLWYLAFIFLSMSIKMSWKIFVEQNAFFSFIEWVAEKINELGIPGFSVTADFSNWVGDGFAWNPPFMGSGTLPIVFILMSLSCIMLMPKIAKAIQSFMAGREFDYGTAIGEAISGGTRPFTSIWNSLGARNIREYYETTAWSNRIGSWKDRVDNLAERYKDSKLINNLLTVISNAMNEGKENKFNSGRH